MEVQERVYDVDAFWRFVCHRRKTPINTLN